MSWVRKRWIVSACKTASLCRTRSECRLLLEGAADHAEGRPKGIAASPHRAVRKELGQRLQGWEVSALSWATSPLQGATGEVALTLQSQHGSTYECLDCSRA